MPAVDQHALDLGRKAAAPDVDGRLHGAAREIEAVGGDKGGVENLSASRQIGLILRQIKGGVGAVGQRNSVSAGTATDLAAQPGAPQLRRQ